MPEKDENHIINRRSPFARVFLFVLNSLILLGYVIMFPIEKLRNNLRNIRQIDLGKLVQLPRTFFYMSRDSYIWFTAVLRVRRKRHEAQKQRIRRQRRRQARKKSQMGVKHLKLKILLTFFIGCFFALMFFAVPLGVYVWYKQLPSPDLISRQTQSTATKILDRNGKSLYEIYIDRKSEPVPLKQVPDDVINATLAIEDAAFYSHPGFDVRSIVRAAKSTFLEDELQGGSTITQQLIKTVLLTPERTYERKIKELALAISVEQKYTKNEILEFYLNNIPYGGTAYGIQAAAQKYFGKNVWELDLAESSMLAGLPNAPTLYSPLQGDITMAKKRQRQVLERMVTLGYITRFEAEVAYDKELTFRSQEEPIRAPHFVNYVRQELYKKLGQRAVDFGGLTVTTTLDLDLQDKIQNIVTEEVRTNGKNLDFSNGAALVLDSKTGQVLAYVGSVDFFNEDGGKFDVVTAYRQPGSSIKPLTYALAFEQGHTAATLVDDSPITYQFSGQKYTPKNYDNKYHGKVSLRQALANSYNIPAVKLINVVGVDKMVQFGIDLGLQNWVVGDGTYGMAITLGGKEVRLLDLTNVYATFARQGKFRSVSPFLNVKDIYGYEIASVLNYTEKEVMSDETAYIITSILSDNNARTPAFGSRSQLYIPDKTIAVKTGTTNEIRDNFTVGYTPSYTVGVWVGNNDNSTMDSRLASGLTGAAPIWNKIMVTLLQGMEDEKFQVPEDIVIKENSNCPNKFEVFNSNFKVPSNICSRKSMEKDED